jgi:hypothetical protein
MPLKSGDSEKTKEENFREFAKGPTYAHTEAKFGKAAADRQRIAVVLSNARKTGHHHKHAKTRLARLR